MLAVDMSNQANTVVAQRSDVASDVRFGDGASVRAKSVRIAGGVSIGDGAVLECDDIVLEAGVQIGRGVRIATERLQLGMRSKIEGDCKIGALGGPAREVCFGDHCLLGASSSVFVPVLLIGDYVKLHNHALINGFAPVYVGHNSWVGQNCVLNANATLFIGNNVGIGTYSSIWTHAFFGELLEGFNVHNVAPTVIEDDAWLVGAYNVVSPGLTIGRRSMVLTSSVVAKDVPPEHTVAGAPARDMTDRIPPVRSVSPQEKLSMMRGFVRDFVAQVYPDEHQADGEDVVVNTGSGRFRVRVCETLADGDIEDDEVALIYALRDARTREQPQTTLFDLTTKRYVKRRSDPEISIIAFMNTSRARFVPAGQERIGVIPTLPRRV
jgi:acetyltransferase-like isoleucine patch superfamily enzyme